MGEARTRETAVRQSGTNRTAAMANRMRRTLSGSAQRQRQSEHTESSPNDYAQSKVQESFAQLTQEAGHLAVGTVQSAYRMGVQQYRQQQAKKQMEKESPLSSENPSSACESANTPTSAPVQDNATTQTVPLSTNNTPQQPAQEAGKRYAQRIATKQQAETKQQPGKAPMPDSAVQEPIMAHTPRTRESSLQANTAKPEASVEQGRKLAQEMHSQRIHSGNSASLETPKIPNGGAAQNIVPDKPRNLSVTNSNVQSAPGRRNGKAHIRTRTDAEVREVVFRKSERHVRSPERMKSGNHAVQKEQACSARKKLEKSRQAERFQNAAKGTAAGTRKAVEILSRVGKAVAKAVRDLIAALSAGGGMILLVVLILVVGGAAALMLASDENDGAILPVSEEVEAYEPLIRQYAAQYGIGDYVLLIEAVMMQESGGRGNDPMQCSECNFNTLYPNTPGGIPDPEYSIQVGIQNLADCLQIAQCESPLDMERIKLALQGYNYGQGYITWAISRYGEYTKANAVEFSMKTAEQLGWSSYGDMDYVSHVLRYYPLGQLFYDPDNAAAIAEVARSQIGNIGGEPYWSWYGFTSHVEWCACFVSWCADQCGYLDSGIFPKFSGCVIGVNWFRARNRWHDGTYTPSPGDMIFFDWTRPGSGQDGIADHVGIVEKVENGRVYTIEGNSNDMCREKSYALGNSQILGYGTLTN